MANIKFTTVTDATRAGGTPADGEYVWTSDTKKFYRGDGTTLGGVLIGSTSSSVSDGDKGDIVVSGSGATWTIDANAVSLSKLAQTTQYKLLGRATAGTGNWEEITATANVYSILQAADYAAMRTLLGLNATISDGSTLSTGLTFPNAGLKLLDLDASNALTLKWDSDDTADRSLSLRVNGSNRVLTINASTTLNGGTIAGGTAALGTSAIASGASATVVTVAATGVATTDIVDWGFNVNPNPVSGYNSASTTGCLVITAYPTAGNVNFVVSNPTASSITPAALTLNWSVRR